TRWFARWRARPASRSRSATTATSRNTSSFTASTPRSATVSAAGRCCRSTPGSAACMTSSVTKPRPLDERALHEYVAEVEGHDSQNAGVVGYFYRMYRDEVRRRVGAVAGSAILEIGCGEGLMFEGTATHPIQMDVSMTRVRRARAKSRHLLCADGYDLPFRSATFEVVLLIAVLEHTRDPQRILAEAQRVLKPGGRVLMVVPNDVTMSVGRLL